jgi:hypothetical protein
MAATAGSQDLGKLPQEVAEVEFKHTLGPGDEGKVPALFGKALKQPQRRKVYFYDTAKLQLSEQSSLVLRARVTQGEDDDSTVKVRPASLKSDAPWRAIGGVAIELDVSGKGAMCSAKLDGEPQHGDVEAVDDDDGSIGSLFSQDQEALVKAYALEGIGVGDLEVLGPVDARKWVFEDLDGFPYKLCIEEWSLPDTTRFIELSVKVKAKKAEQAQDAFHGLLKRLGVDLAKAQEQKTPRVLQFFAERL